MAVWSVPRTWAVGELVTAGMMNQYVRDEFSFLYSGRYACRAYTSVAVAVATSTWTSIALNSERYDVGPMHDTVTNNTRLTFPDTGIYAITGYAVWSAGNVSGTLRSARLELSDGTTLDENDKGVPPSIGAGWAIGVSAVYPCAAGQWVTLDAFQDSGASHTVALAELAAVMVG